MLATTHVPTTMNVAAPLAIRLFRRDGAPRTRYSDAERLQLLEANPNELDTYLNLFARRRTPYIIQRAAPDGKRGPWSTVNHRLPADAVVRHLLADRIPSVPPSWVGTRAWETTSFVAIDVDIKAPDFDHRIALVESALYRLGVPRRYWVILPSPSGGRHYYFFLRRPIETGACLMNAFQLVGLRHRPGQHEIFPDQNRCLRLPFGFIPGRTHNNQAWLDFVRKYRAGEIPLVNWERCIRRASSYLTGKHVLPQLSKTTPVCVSSAAQRPAATITKSALLSARSGLSKKRPTYSHESAPRICPKGIDRLWREGISGPGERRAATIKLAWNFLFIRKMPEDAVVEQLVEWVYRTGRSTSADVGADMVKGSRRVAQQTRAIIAYLSKRRKNSRPTGRLCFAPSDIDLLLEFVARSPAETKLARFRFALDLLNFAKKARRPVLGGWECCPSVRGVIRNWDGCSGMRYKPLMEWAVEIGLIKLVREKRQTANGTGRARTYRVCVPRAEYEQICFTYTGSLEYAARRLNSLDQVQVGVSKAPSVQCESDTYSVMEESLKGTRGVKASDPNRESLALGITDVTEEARRGSISRYLRQDHRIASFPRNIDEPQQSSHERSGTYTQPAFDSVGAEFSECQHPRCADRRVAKSEAQRPSQSHGLSRVLCAAPGDVRSIPGVRPRIISHPNDDCYAAVSAALETVDREFVANAVTAMKQRAPRDETDPVAAQQHAGHVIWRETETMANGPSTDAADRRFILTSPFDLPACLLGYRARLMSTWRARPRVNQSPAADSAVSPKRRFRRRRAVRFASLRSPTMTRARLHRQRTSGP